ncbi:MAG: tail fiber domain-containing protein [Dokdonella sp.]
MSPKLLTLALLIAAANVSAEPWTYSGTLSDGDKPANGRYDLRVTLLDATRSNPIGSPITFYSVQVHDGAFTVDVDFGSDISNAPPMRLKTEISKNSAPFVALGEPTRFDPKVALVGVCWDTKGNAGTDAATDFIGTTDSEPLVMRASAQRVATFRARGTAINYGDSPSMTLGSSANAAAAVGATVSGGGATRNGAGVLFSDWENQATGLFSTVGGGRGNTSRGDDSTISGGQENYAYGDSATIIGGYKNEALATGSTVVGGLHNCAGGANSLAAGLNSKIRGGFGSNNSACGFGEAPSALGDEGTFVWTDSKGSPFISTGSNQFLVRAAGGVAINTATKPNGSPIDAELTITSNTARPDTNVEIFMYPRLSSFGYLMGVQATQQSDDTFFITQTDGNSFLNRLKIDGNGTTFVQGGAVGNLSDVRLKKNIGPIPRPLDQLLALQGHVYEYIDPAKAMNAPGPRMGFVAQEVRTVLPNWVKPTGNEGYLAVTPIGFEALAVEAMRDLKAENDVRMEALEKENASLRARLERLEAKVKP